MFPDIIAIAAVGENGVIGDGKTMSWYVPEDLKLFRSATMGHPIIMGYNTFKSLGETPLEGRRNIVVSKNHTSDRDDVEFVPSFPKAIELLLPCPEDEKIFVIGGGELYRTALPLCTLAIISYIPLSPAGDVTFPLEDLERDFEKIMTRESFDCENNFKFKICEYCRKDHAQFTIEDSVAEKI